MPWFEFTDTYVHRISAMQRKKYPKGMVMMVPKDHAEGAKAAGKGDYRYKPEGMKVSKTGMPLTGHFMTDRTDGADQGSQPDTPEGSDSASEG